LRVELAKFKRKQAEACSTKSNGTLSNFRERAARKPKTKSPKRPLR
jgi:hypothetical protein